VTRHLVVIGAQRCGTTLLHEVLDAHPDITMARPGRPEPKVFVSDELAGRGYEWYRATYFAHATSESVLGDKSTSYLEDAKAADRAAAVLGAATVVVQLRDPVARAVSNWRLSTGYGLEDRTLARALWDSLRGPRAWDPACTSVSPYAYLERGRYVDQLEPWWASFPGSVRVQFLEEATSRPQPLADLYAALDVDPGFRPPDPTRRVNASRGEPPPDLEPGLMGQLQDYYRDPDSRLAARLGRPLPWTGS